MKTHKKCLHRLGILLLVIGVSIVLTSCIKTESEFETVKKNIVESAKKACPIMVDEDTRLDSVKLIDENVLAYNYTIINYTKAQLDVKALQNTLSVSVLKGLKADPALKILLDNKITMLYSYKDKKDEFLFSLKYTYDDYKD